MQEDVAIGEYGVTGTLKYVTGYTGFSGDPAEQNGNYLVLHFEVEDEENAVIQAKLEKGNNPNFVTLDSDGILIVRISDAAQDLIVKASLSGYKTVTKHIPLHGLVLEQEA